MSGDWGQAKKPKVGFIGVGLMGHGMARGILAKDFALTVMANRNRAPVDDLLARGASEAKTPAELAAHSDIVILCVTDSSIVESVLLGAEGVLAGGRPGMVVADCSTADPASTMMVAERLAAAGIGFCDCPLTGTPTQADEGKLGVIGGGSEADFATIRPVLEAFAVKIDHLGPVGTGHKMKLINNFLAMSYAALYGEALALGRKVGVPPETVYRVITGTRMDSGFFQTYVQYTLNGNKDAHKFALKNGLKDLRYVEALALASNTLNPMGSAARNLFAHAVAIGRGEDYVPLLAEVIADLNGLPRQDA